MCEVPFHRRLLTLCTYKMMGIQYFHAPYPPQKCRHHLLVFSFSNPAPHHPLLFVLSVHLWYTIKYRQDNRAIVVFPDTTTVLNLCWFPGDTALPPSSSVSPPFSISIPASPRNPYHWAGGQNLQSCCCFLHLCQSFIKGSLSRGATSRAC